MPRTTLRLAVIALTIGAMGTVLRLDSAPNTQSAVLVGYGSSLIAAPGATNPPGAASLGTTSPSFSIAGKVSGLSPGKTLSLVLTLGNPNKLTITVMTVTTAAGNATSSCTAAYVSASGFSGHLAIAAGKTGKVTVKVTMKSSAPQSCEGKSFPLLYTGSGTEA